MKSLARNILHRGFLVLLHQLCQSPSSQGITASDQICQINQRDLRRRFLGPLKIQLCTCLQMEKYGTILEDTISFHFKK